MLKGWNILTGSLQAKFHLHIFESMHNFVTIHHDIVNKHALVPFFDTYLWTHVTNSWRRLHNLMINNWSRHQFHLHLKVRRYNTHAPSLFQHCSNQQKTKIAANDKHLALIHVWSGITQTDCTTKFTGRYSLAKCTFPFTKITGRYSLAISTFPFTKFLQRVS